MMRNLIQGFPEQLDHAFGIAGATSFSAAPRSFTNVIISGLGGSGIGGKIAAQALLDDLDVPVAVVNDYLLPRYIGADSLVICSSYSGNTEETVSVLNDALARGCTIACISSGGEVTRLAQHHGLDLVAIPGGQPPRSQFGYSFVSLLRILEAYGLVHNIFNTLSSLGAFLRSNQTATEARAKQLAAAIGSKTIVLYAEARNEGVAVRWRQQINENAKRLCWHHVYPEMNHNELVGWEGGSDTYAVLMLRSSDDYPRSVARMNITEGLFLAKGATVENIIAIGNTRLERVFDLIHLGDWLSLVMAERDGIDPVSIDAINYLKDALSKLP